MDHRDSESSASRLLAPYTEKAYDFSESAISRVRQHRKTWLWVTGCAMAAITLLATYFALRSRSFVPNFGHRQVLFQPDNRFLISPGGPNSPWSELEPFGRGFVKVPPNQQKDIGPGLPMKDGTGEYCISVFHQLHCLAILRGAINTLRGDDTSAHGSPHNDETPNGGGGHDHLLHADHCIDYLRQAVMCSGDMTLEHYFVYENGTLGPGVDGYFVNHQCKNWDHIMEFATQHRSRDVEGIL